jgi:hypothetical protein
MRAALAALLLLAPAFGALAHDPSRALLTLTADGDAVHGRLDVSLRDLEDAVGLDADGDAAITWGELRTRGADVASYAARRIAIEADGVDCPLTAAHTSIDMHGGASYAVLDLAARCAAPPRSLRVRYALLFDVDPAHRALLELRAGAARTTAVLSAERPELAADLAALRPWASFGRFVREGVWHIWHGYDHLAFVTLLVLPIVLGGVGGSARPRPSARTAVVSIAAVITAFTAAHSLTLALATLGVVSVPSRAVESVIALSVLAAALVNVLPSVPRLGARLAFGFGLVHGLGFASALGDLGAADGGVAASLAGFNAGVELGQLAVVAAALPALFALRVHRLGRLAANYACSGGCAALAIVWLVDRLVA